MQSGPHRQEVLIRDQFFAHFVETKNTMEPYGKHMETHLFCHWKSMELNRQKPKRKIVSHHFSGVDMLVFGFV